MNKALLPATAGFIAILALAACNQPVAPLNGRDQGAVAVQGTTSAAAGTVDETVIDCSINPRGKSEIALFRQYCLN